MVNCIRNRVVLSYLTYRNLKTVFARTLKLSGGGLLEPSAHITKGLDYFYRILMSKHHILNQRSLLYKSLLSGFFLRIHKQIYQPTDTH